MSIAERHKFILEKLAETGTVKVLELSQEMGVSVVTIRKDLRVLEERGALYRSHGSASSRSLFINDRSVMEKQGLRFEEKQGIAAAAVELLVPGEAIIIGSGSTARYFAEHLPDDMPLTVITGAMNVSQVLLEKSNLELIQLGGSVRKNASSVVGPWAEEMLSHFACAKLFLGVDGISQEYGLTTSNLMEAHLNRVMIRSVQKTIVLCDSSKIEQRGVGRICDIEEVDVIVTDAGVSGQVIDAWEAQGLEVRVV